MSVYNRIHHAAHTGIGSGWDLERWVFVAETNARPDDVPPDAEYHSGFRDAAGVQHWIYVRKAPFSDGECSRCNPVLIAAEMFNRGAR